MRQSTYAEIYADLVEELREAGVYSPELITLEVGSRGAFHQAGFDDLKHYLCAPSRAWDAMLVQITGTVIKQSHKSWVKAVQELPHEVMKFSINASLNTLPTNSNLQNWGKKAYSTCSLCHESRQSLSHVLNNCPRAMELRRYSKRHDEVLAILGDFIQTHLRQNFSITLELPLTTYSFPQHITPTDMRPDIVWWSEECKELWLLELTISYESQVADSCLRKRAKYQDLVEAGCMAGFRTELITIEVGSRGMLSDVEFETLKSTFNVPGKTMTSLCLQVIRTTILESFKIWCSRNLHVQ